MAPMAPFFEELVALVESPGFEDLPQKADEMLRLRKRAPVP